MLEMDFVNDIKDNYLAIKCKREDDFLENMIIKNDIPYFLQVEKRCLNGEDFLYYKITGKQTIQTLWSERQIAKEFFEALLESLKAAIENAQDYFLPVAKICLQPDKIFWNYDKKKAEFVYLPEYEGDADWTGLADFFIDRIDYSDERLVDLAQQFYEQVENKQLTLDTFWMKEDAAPYFAEMEENVYKEDIQTTQDEMYRSQSCREEYINENINSDNEMNDELEEHRRKPDFRIWQIVLWVVSVLVTIVITCLSGKIYLPGACIMIALSAFLLGKSIYRNKKEDEERERERKEMNQAMLNGEWEGEEAETGTLAWDNEKTVYMDLSETKQRKLYGTGAYKKYRFELSELPCTIGKDKNLVTHVIEEQTISRMHARFFEEEGMVWIQDLNSTNGTYQNGMRLRPNQKIPVEAEDELIFGGVTFVYL
ncbi:MAG: FHA domain-containing protein [Lachnospiraceae bacterium]|nr:FHA domain-containing protein [Lachnospiraceae bacterium]